MQIEPTSATHTEEQRRAVERRAAEIYQSRSFDPKSFLEMCSFMDPPYGDRAAVWWAILTYIEKLEKAAKVRSHRSPKLR